MKKFSRVIQWMLGIGFVFIGILHLHAHYTQLINEQTANMMAQEVPEMGVSYYQLYIGMSFMMGVCFIVIGLLNIFLAKTIEKDAYPSIATTIPMIILMSSVAYCGYNFFGPMQLYSGAIMSGLLIITLFFSLTNKS